jgi:hypothetical protein
MQPQRFLPNYHKKNRGNRAAPPQSERQGVFQCRGRAGYESDF